MENYVERREDVGLRNHAPLQNVIEKLKQQKPNISLGDLRPNRRNIPPSAQQSHQDPPQHQEPGVCSDPMLATSNQADIQVCLSCFLSGIVVSFPNFDQIVC